ncbi:MAG TPA: alkaline phosphatase family protein [Candidatus Elarobacter sp.]
MRPRARAALLAAAFAIAASAALAGPALTLLPTGWSIRAPQGAVARVGTFPQAVVVSHDGSRVFELEAGYLTPALRVLDATSLREVRKIELTAAYGVPLRDAGGDGMWIAIAGAFQEQLAHVDPARGNADRNVSLGVPFFPVAIARAPNGMLAVAGDLADRVAFVDPAAEHVVWSAAVGRHPAALEFSADGATLYVADRAESQLDIIDVAGRAVTGRIAVGLHPSALARAGDRLYAADTDDDDIAVVDLSSRRTIARAPLPFAHDGAVGASPNALALDGDRLYVSCGAANAIAVFRTTASGLVPLGAIPTGWYPTALAVDGARGVLYVADAKGESGHPNPKFTPFPMPMDGSGSPEYIAKQLTGSIRRIAIPDDAALARGLDDVRGLAQHEPLPPSAIVRANGPIRHVVYVVKENRSYDQVLGDLKGADGDPRLMLFGERITPNQHALARRFGTFDRFFENAHISADGHSWSTAAFANDYLERMWPPNYARRRPLYDFEDAAGAAVPHGRYLWNDALEHGVSVRNYGEFVTAGAAKPTPVTASDDALRAHTDRAFPTYDMKVRDVDRFAEWKREFDAFELSGTLPQLEIVRFPRDHTAGTREKYGTPFALVGDNDLAVGRLVDAISHSPDWASTAIFVIEDDAQNGPDHVDEQRAPFWLISPYAAGGVQHARYTQASVLRTIEILLDLPPLSPYDAGALPLTAAFRTTPDLRPFRALPARINLEAKNRKDAYRALESARIDLDRADRADPGVLNDIVWHAVKGAAASPPPYGLFRSAASRLP